MNISPVSGAHGSSHMPALSKASSASNGPSTATLSSSHEHALSQNYASN
jgi:hypothetical protein